MKRITADPVEEWRQVIGYEGFYSVSNLGMVRRDVNSTRNFTLAGKILKPHLYQGYCRVDLSICNVKKCWSIHRLVAMAWIGPIPEGMQVNHINFDKSDNRIENLEYVTHKQNVEHSTVNMMQSNKLTPDAVRAIRQRVSQGSKSYKAIGLEYGVSSSCVHKIKDGQIWDWLV